MKRAIILVCGCVALNSAAVAERGDKTALDRFERTGETVNCVSMRSTSITAVDETRLLFKVGAGTYYLNEVRGQCKDVDSSFTRLEIRMFGSQICSSEIIDIVDQQTGLFHGACSLGEFEKLAPKPAPEPIAD